MCIPQRRRCGLRLRLLVPGVDPLHHCQPYYLGSPYSCRRLHCHLAVHYVRMVFPIVADVTCRTGHRLVVPLRVRREVIGFCFIVSAQLAFNIAFAFLIIDPEFPCHGFGSELTCKKYQRGLVIGNWILAGSLVLYTACLAMMAYVQCDDPHDMHPTDAQEKGLHISAESEAVSTKLEFSRSITVDGTLVSHRRDSTSSFGTFRDLRNPGLRQWNHCESLVNSPVESSTSFPGYPQQPSPTMTKLNRSFVFPRQTIPQDVDENNVVYLAYAPESPMTAFADGQSPTLGDPEEDDEVGSPYYKAGGFIRPTRRLSVLFPSSRFSSGTSGLPQSPKSSPRPPLTPATSSILISDAPTSPLPHAHSASTGSFMDSAASFTLVTASPISGKWHRRTTSVHLSSRATSEPLSPLPTPGTPSSPRVQFSIDTTPLR
ncbi:hypothetical protein BDV98DRAFT_32840 [Pterulicium gracile]|uniref:Uncharacterized protein n=1 Tax=Pterulicium gracile TaxID=1884261 RepID=A0A5C3R057_9AGAR|nr:hypothetical protein BDV98DRAFT_32840 [Pterula gracilis]